MSTPHGGPSSTDGPLAPAPAAPASASGSAPAPAGVAVDGSVPPPDVPVRADGVQLLGETKGSGYREAPSLVRRADGQTLQLTPLLYLILDAIDGERGLADIAERASAGSGRLVSADNVRTLIDSQLLPLGLLQLADGSQPEVKKANPLLGMRFRYSVTDPERTRKLTAPFAVLFNPLIVVAVTAAFLAICWWVLMVKGLASATHEAFANPALVLLVVAVTVLSAGFHEFGHAAAARRGGATPGAMGAGLYLIWPAFYTDVTDSYRLGRGGRIRTDLGGLYFNAIVAVAIMGIWWATGFDALLLVVVTQLIQMVRQLLPLVRFDGYHILADATGVPDLFQRIKPTLLSLLPWRPADPAAQVLKPWARTAVTVWVLVTVPLLIFSLVMMVISLPRLLGTAWSGTQKQYAQFNGSLANGDILDAAVRILAITGDRASRPGHLLHPDPARPAAAHRALAENPGEGRPARHRPRRGGSHCGRTRLGLVAGGRNLPPGPVLRTRHHLRRHHRVLPLLRRGPHPGGPARAYGGPLAGRRHETHPRRTPAEHGPGPARRRNRHRRHRGAVVGVPVR